jgi:chromosome segregation protein
MYLKGLEMVGFKSFASRAGLEFVPGITAVVGPNGSGKSNVTDAIRWVLGEQSAKSLRGAKMEDVIFAGSDSRKPIGYCEVSITFDNTTRRLPIDYTEVTVIRRVYRSGESEYFLNKQSCRLKDIDELFMDTGIGTDAYSMIGQGKIDAILSSKAEERRLIFEEVAGIVKYKTRKKEAGRKLEGTEQNLARIHDLMYELESQIQPLTEQADRAKRYKALQAELQTVEVGLYVHKIETLHEQWQHATQDVKQLSEEQISLAAEVSKKEAVLEELKFQGSRQEEQREQVQAELLSVSGELKEAEALQQVHQERCQNHDVNYQQMEERCKQLEAEAARLQVEEQQWNEQFLLKRGQLQHLQSELEQIDAQASLPDEEEAESCNQLVVQLQAERERMIMLESEQQYLVEQQQQGAEGAQVLQRQEEELLQQQSAQTQQVDLVSKQLSIVAAELQEIAGQAESLAEKRTRLENEANSLQHQLQQVEQQSDRLRTQAEWMQALEAEHQGFMQGVKEILQAKDRNVAALQGIHGAVAQLIQVPAAYEAALETALGGAMQHIVVENEDSGRQGIAYLKEKRLGRATFLPLDVIQSRFLPTADRAKLQQLSGCVGVASELVQCEERYRTLLQHVLGLVIVSETLVQANQIARQLRYRYRVVTLEGDVVNSGGSMAGGSRPQTKTSLLGRSRQLEELAAEMERSQVEEKKFQQQLQQIEQQQVPLAQAWQELENRQQERRLQEQELREQARELTFAQRSLQEQLEQVQQAQMERGSRQESLQRQGEERAEQLQQVAQCKRQLETEVEASRARMRTQAFHKEQMTEQMTEHKVSVARLHQEVVSFAQNIERVQEACARVQAQKEVSVQALGSLDGQKEANEQEMVALHERIVHLQERKEEIQIRLHEMRLQREQVMRSRDAQEHDLRAAQQLWRKQGALLHEVEVRANRFDVELNHLLQKLAEEYETSFERAQQMYTIPAEPAQAQVQVGSLKSQMALLGEVNLGAVEEHQRLTERLYFLQTQEADLLAAKESLYQMIAQMETEMGKRFAESFSQIRDEFQAVFASMFAGGQADLSLSDPDHLLTTGIEIVAQPPGKKLKSLTLLSGGERALVAIALLFSVLRVKPVPFCVLDEVDAALDEANLTRFTRYLREFAHKTQFILITHRKQTMENADVLYGVTMQESGISKLVSVKLEAYDGKREVAVAIE